MLDELLLLKRIKNNDIQAFEKLFRLYYQPLCRYADSFVNDMPVSEEIVQDLFYYLWKERELIHIQLSVKSYLYQAVQNKSFHHLKHMQVRESYKEKMTENNLEHDNTTPSDDLEYKELETQLSVSLNKLPERQRKIFCMNRFGGKKYNEIAQELSVSIKTVEADMTKVLAALRKELKHFSNTNFY